jgi:hypothetical protein
VKWSLAHTHKTCRADIREYRDWGVAYEHDKVTLTFAVRKQRLQFFTFEFHLHIIESKEVTKTDIRAIARLGSVSEFANLETFFSDG